ncbi:unnamed protein product [Meloidogyne enterolobii]|uniref:Uncharacterized protein n=1 Tax=Meloidogyne enterolobii TaxID=390850 RepID=A0ACB1ASJ2_MELEN
MGVLLNSSEFMESSISNFEECEKIIFDEQFPEYIGRMLIISGLARKNEYYVDIADRIINYIKNRKYEELLTFVVIHHGNNFVEIAKILKDKIIASEDANLVKIENDVLGLDAFFKFILSEGDEANEEIVEDKGDVEDEEIFERNVEEIEDDGFVNEDEEDGIAEEDERDLGKASDSIASYGSIASFDSDYDELSPNLKCLSYTEKEYGTEVKMGNFEYEYTADYHNGDWIKLNDLCRRMAIFENDLDSILEYLPSKMKRRGDFKTFNEWKNGQNENSISSRIEKLKKRCEEIEQVMASKSEFTCSRYHPITDSTDPFTKSDKNRSASLLTILEYIQSLSDYDKLRWELQNKLFLPLPQWRRQELAKLYCEKVFKIYVGHFIV